MTSKAEFIPSCAVVGSILSQEVLNALGGKQAPLANFLVFDGEKCSGDIYALGVQRDQS
jgi:ubiquitin-like 1-activating enzyme E1 A